MKAVLAFLFMFVFLILTSCSVQALDAWFESGTVKIRQDSAVGDQITWQIKSARNEFEPFQLALKNSENMSQVDVEISDFTGPGTIASGNVTIFWEGYINVINASTIEGQTGEWPDVLCPKVDAYYHEARNCFPFNLTSGRIQPLWFDVFVPESTVPGSYQATVRVTSGGSEVFSGAVNLEVWNFSLPATSSLQSNFVSDWNGIWRAYYGGTWPPGSFTTLVELQRLYIKAGLRHRMTFTPISIQWGTWNATLNDYSYVTDSYFHQSLAGFLGDSNSTEYGNSSMTSIWKSLAGLYSKYLCAQQNKTAGACTATDIVNACTNLTGPPPGLMEELIKNLEITSAKMTPAEKSLFMILPIDEPGTGGDFGKCSYTNPMLDYNTSKLMAEEIHNAGFKTLITRSRKAELLNTSAVPPRNDYWDSWVSPFNNIVGHTWDGIFFNNRSLYDEDIANGASLWWYTACGTHGCAAATGGAGYNGYPQYSVDYQGIYTRIFAWMLFKYDIQGEELWSTTSEHSKDPWYILWSTVFGGNGDGNFLYPGVPNTTAAGLPYASTFNNVTTWRGNHTPSIGGIHNIPIESIRLKMIREGYEDYEYFKLLKDLGDDAFAKNETSNLVNNTYNFSHNPDELYASREAVALRILNVLGNPPCIHTSEISPCDGCISQTELDAFIGRWKVSNVDVTLKELMEAIGYWKRGC
jgi:hypothetical protein